MANPVRTQILVDGDLDNVLSLSRDAETEFSFERIFPIPQGLTEEESYVWRASHWETEFEASSVYIEEHDSIYLETAWYPPIGVISKLSTLLPKVSFKVEWSTADVYDEDFEAEKLLIKNGRICYRTPVDIHNEEGQELYQKLWGALTHEEIEALQN